MTALISTPALAASFGSRMLQMGMRGSDVKTLQKDLSLTGFSTRVTGVFNRTTRNHVEGFQASHHLTADGVVGPRTAQAIRSAVAQAHASNAGSGAGVSVSRTSTSTPTPATATPATTSTTASSPAPTPGASAPGTTTTPAPNSGGTGMTAPPPNSPPETATLDSSGLAVAPPDAPMVIRQIITAANKIAFRPYVYGGGHQSFNSSGYDCSGSVSYALHGGGLLSSPLDSTEFESWGASGYGTWITIWANGGHAFMEIAGLYFDTAAQDSRGQDRWSTTRVSPRGGFTVRHPANW